MFPYLMPSAARVEKYIYSYWHELLLAPVVPAFDKQHTPVTFWHWKHWFLLQTACANTTLVYSFLSDKTSHYAWCSKSARSYFWTQGYLHHYVFFQQSAWFYYHATRGLAVYLGKPCRGQRSHTNRQSARATSELFFTFLTLINTTKAQQSRVARNMQLVGSAALKNHKLHAIPVEKKKKQVLSKHAVVKKQAKDKLKKKLQKQKKSIWNCVINLPDAAIRVLYYIINYFIITRGKSSLSRRCVLLTLHAFITVYPTNFIFGCYYFIMTRSLTIPLVYRLHEKIQPWHLETYCYVLAGSRFTKKYCTAIHLGCCWGRYIWTRRRVNYKQDIAAREARGTTRHCKLQHIYYYCFTILVFFIICIHSYCNWLW